MAFHECRQEDRLGETLSMSVSALWRDAGGEAEECETMDWVKIRYLFENCSKLGNVLSIIVVKAESFRP